ncbi:MAG: type IV pilus secretin PilQ [SAR86 cluster bacterium]|uniref:Type IV pilus secretin PilQ n=1 Tax=SAR86 cluster bacterium TaxID=2030880 RepID=A0A2A5B4D8_9GAMM|nr:MAG: type IV pilus secretin PilQ [SAR86 cluster bacterium]
MCNNNRKQKHPLLAMNALVASRIKFIQSLGFAFLAMAFSSAVSAQQTVTLEGIGFANLPGDSIEIQLSFDSVPPDATGFVIDNPARISLDLPGVASGLLQQRFNIDSNNAQSVMVLDDGNRTRLVINLDQLVNYETQLVGNVLTIQVGNDAQAGGVASAGQAFSGIAGGNSNSINDVSFRRGTNGEGQVVIELSSDRVIGSVEQVGERVYVEFSNTTVPNDLNRRLDVSDFATVVSTVDVLGQAGRATIVVDINGAYEYVAFQSGNQYTISVSPPVADITSTAATAAYTGEISSMSFQDIPIRSVLQILAEIYDFSLVVGDAVSGNVTIVLDNVPWDQALELVLRTDNLGSRLEGNVLYVAPANEIAAQEQLELDAIQQAQALAPLYTEFVQVNYADADDIMALLTGSGSGGGGGPDLGAAGGAGGVVSAAPSGGILSSRGTATVDSRTNIIIVRDIEEKLEEVRAMLTRLDVPVRQVLIEARIVNVSTNYGRDLGIRWGGAGSAQTGDNFRYGGSQEATLEQSNSQVAQAVAVRNALIAGDAARVQALQDGTDPSLIQSLVNQAISGVPIPIGTTTFPDALAVDLGISAPGASSFSIGFTGASGLIELELSALESSGNGEVIARPKVTTQDKVQAVIESGVRIPYQTQAGGTAGGSTTEFEDAVLSLTVTPQITPDGRINMELDIRQDSVAAGSGAIPAINTNRITTSALVNNGETIVLGGVFREESTTTETKTPFLGDLPYVGRLFKRTEHASRRTELLIFITPKIIAEINIR